MSLEELAASVAVIAIVFYAVFGGADFGGGIWTLFATGPRKGEQRDALERAIGPVWETNHVWLILLVVVLFVVFPTAYATIFTALYIPLFLALAGIVARGAAFAFRHYADRGSALSHTALRAFSVASLLTPFTFGLCIGAVASGDVELSGSEVESGPFEGWLTPFAIVCGVIGLLICAYIAAAFMMPRTVGALREDFRRRALLSSLALGAATLVAIPVAAWDADEFSSRLDRGEVVGAMLVTAILGVLALLAIYRGRAQLGQLLAGLTVGGVVVAWALAMNPDMLIEQLTLHDAAADRSTVGSFLLALPFGAIILVPSLYLLFRIFALNVLGGEPEPGDAGPAG